VLSSHNWRVVSYNTKPFPEIFLFFQFLGIPSVVPIVLNLRSGNVEWNVECVRLFA
jgi:hypothetical protein